MHSAPVLPKSLFKLLLALCFAFSAHAGWERIEVPDAKIIHDLSFIDDSIGIALMDGSFDYQVHYTTDGGETWTQMSESSDDLGTVGGEFARIHLVSAMEGYLIPIISGSNSPLLRTTDAGANFEPVPNPFPVARAAHFFDSQTFWLAGRPSSNSIVALTQDGGVSWATKETPILFSPTDIWFLDPNHGWIIGTIGNVLRTADGGETWEKGNFESSTPARTIRFADPMRGWLVGDDGMLMATVDGGRSWVQVLDEYTDFDFDDLEVLGPNWVMVAGGRGGDQLKLVTQDGGVNWFPENTPRVVGVRPLARGGDTLFTGGGDDPAIVVGSGPSLLFRRKVGTMESPTIKAVPLGSAVVGLPYEHRVRAYEGAEPYTWSLDGKGAPGISIDPSTGLLSGTPTQAGVATISIRVTDANGASDVWTTTLRAAPDALFIARPDLPDATHRLTYRASVGLSGGNPPYTAEIVSGELPYGVTVDEEGVVAGVPQEVGEFSFTVRFADSSSPASTVMTPFSLSIAPLLESRWDVQHAHNRLMDIHFFDEDHGIAIGWSGVFYDTLDGGKTWTHRLFEPGVQMTEFAWIGDKGWMTAGSEIYHTINRGKTWTSQGRPLFTATGISFFDENRGCATGTGIAYTEDGGETWTPAQVPSSSFVFSLDFATETVAWAGGDDGLFMKSTDGGKSWTAMDLPEIGVAKSNGISMHPDGSVSYHPDGRDEKGALTPAQVPSIFFLNELEGWVGTNLLVAAQTTRVYRTVDGGESWTNQTVNRQVNIQNIQFMEDGLTGFASGVFSPRVWRTTNGGTTWISTNLTGVSDDVSFWGMTFLDADAGWVLYNILGDKVDNFISNLEGSIWKTEDGAETFFKQYGWDEKVETEPTTGVTSRKVGPDIWRIHFFDPVNAVALGKPSSSRGSPFEIYRTGNAGATWKHVQTSPVSQDMAFLDEDHFWGFTSVESLDGGANWIPRSDLVPGLKGDLGNPKSINTPRGVFFLDDRHGWLRTRFFDPDNFFQETARILRTRDGGGVWEVASTKVTTREFEFFFANEDQGYRFAPRGAVDPTVIEMTNDGGSTWETVYERAASEEFWEIETLFAPDDSSGWAVGDKGVAARRIAGATEWETVQFPEDWVLHDVEFNACTGGLIVGGEDLMDGPPVILHSTDEHFTLEDRVSLPIVGHELRSVEIVDSANIYAYGGFGLGLKYAAPTDSLAVSTSRLDEGRQGSPYSFALEALQGQAPFFWTVCSGNLPEGVALSSGGEFSGTPVEPGDFHFTVAVSDSTGRSASKRYTLRILPDGAPAIQPETLPNGAIDAPYAIEFSASGTVSPYSWSLIGGTPPPGFHLKRIGFFGGTTQAAGTYEFEVEVRDSQSPRGRARKAYTLTIEGELDPVEDDCTLQPFFCLSRDWKATGSGLSSDRNGDNSVDATDLLAILEEARGTR